LVASVFAGVIVVALLALRATLLHVALALAGVAHIAGLIHLFFGFFIAAGLIALLTLVPILTLILTLVLPLILTLVLALMLTLVHTLIAGLVLRLVHIVLIHLAAAVAASVLIIVSHRILLSSVALSDWRFTFRPRYGWEQPAIFRQKSAKKRAAGIREKQLKAPWASKSAA
jgi:hypothetical protein